MTDITINDLSAGVALTATDLIITRKSSNTDDTKSLMSEVKTFTTTTSNNLSVFASGTIYTLTATPAAVAFGSTSPNLTLTLPGTYHIRARVILDYNAATFAAVRTATLKLRRTNNTAADLADSSTAIKTRIVTTETSTLMVVTWGVDYTTANSTDAIAIFGSLDVVPTAGSLQVSEACVFAERHQL